MTQFKMQEKLYDIRPGPTSAEIATKAAELMSGDRQAQHGDKRDNHERIARMWNAWLQSRRDPAAPLQASDVAAMMALLKLARTQSGNFNPDDSLDGTAYMAIFGELQAREN